MKYKVLRQLLAGVLSVAILFPVFSSFAKERVLADDDQSQVSTTTTDDETIPSEDLIPSEDGTAPIYDPQESIADSDIATLDELYADDNEYSEDFINSMDDAPYEIGELIVMVDHDMTADDLEAIEIEANSSDDAMMEDFECEELDSLLNETTLLIQYDPTLEITDVISHYLQMDEVVYAQPNYIYSLPDDIECTPISAEDTSDELAETASYTLWMHTLLGTQRAWTLFDSQIRNHYRIRVAVIDQGADYTYSDFSGVIDRSLSVNAVDEISPLTEEWFGSHGTNVCGIIGARNDNDLSTNYTGVTGVASNNLNDCVSIMSINVFDGEYANSVDIARGIDYAVDNGARVINLSLGSYMTGTDRTDRAYYSSLVAAEQHGVVCVASSGNDGDKEYASVYHVPSDYDTVIAVNAVASRASSNTSKNWSTSDHSTSPSAYHRCFFSNYNEYKDISAPGFYLYSVGGTLMSGTSQATPVVTATIALMLSSAPTLSPTDVRNKLYATATDLVDTSNDEAIGRDDVTGWGLVNTYAAVKSTLPEENFSDDYIISTATQTGMNEVTFAWYARPNVNYYVVTRTISGGATTTYNCYPVTTGDPLTYSYVDTNVEQGKTYTYSIRAVYLTARNYRYSPQTITIDFPTYPNTYEGFIDRLYNLCLDRPADAAGYQDWLDALSSGQSGAFLAHGFLFSDEMQRKNLSNEEFIRVLYRVLLNRNPDSKGIADWLTYMDETDSTRYGLLSMFSKSDEFQRLCNQCCINSTPFESPYWRDRDENITRFVIRLYNLCLGRDGDPNGLENWTGGLLRHEMTGRSVATYFCNSPELVGMNLNNSQFVFVLYRSILGREPDTNGLNHWVGILNSGTSRASIVDGFIISDEFGIICNNYGVVRG